MKYNTLVAVVILTIATLLSQGCGSCARGDGPQETTAVDTATSSIADQLNPLTPVPGQDYSVLTKIAGTCSILAVITIVASVYIGGTGKKTRRAAATLIACAVGAWMLRIFLFKYAGPAVAVAIVLGVVFGALYAWGHRWWFEETTGLEVTGDGILGDPRKLK
jgi:hypothetical protein